MEYANRAGLATVRLNKIPVKPPEAQKAITQPAFVVEKTHHVLVSYP
jgi:hypothetical protein